MTEFDADTVVGDRPSRHGKLLGEALADLAEAGRIPGAPDLCATCAFRRGSMPNQTAATGKLALDIVLRIDTDDFACHHGMSDGRPTKLCVGAYLAKQVSFTEVRRVIGQLRDKLDAMSGTDEVRVTFDRWWDGVDPDKTMSVYELASAYARLASLPTMDPVEGGVGRDA